MRTLPEWRADRDAKIVALAKQKVTIMDIAERLTIGRTTVQETLNRVWPDRPKVHRQAPKGWWQEEGREVRLAEMWRAGQPSVLIGAALGCTGRAVIGKARRLKLPPHPFPGRRRRKQ